MALFVQCQSCNVVIPIFNMAVNVSGIPVVDFGAMSLKNKDTLNESDEAIKDLANQIYQAFSTIGFVYLKNHGIPQEVVSFIQDRRLDFSLCLGNTDFFVAYLCMLACT